MFYWRTKQQLGDALRMKRIELDFSQEYISLEIAIDRMGLSALENGRTNPTLFYPSQTQRSIADKIVENIEGDKCVGSYLFKIW